MYPELFMNPYAFASVETDDESPDQDYVTADDLDEVLADEAD